MRILALANIRMSFIWNFLYLEFREQEKKMKSPGCLPLLLMLFFVCSWSEELPSPPVKADIILSLSAVVFSPGSDDSWKTRCLWHEVIASLDEWSGDIRISWKDLRKVNGDSALYFRKAISESIGFKENDMAEKKDMTEKLLRMRARQAVIVLLGAPHHDSDHRHQLILSMDEIAEKASVTLSQLLPIELRKRADTIIKETVNIKFQEMLSAFGPLDIRRLVLDEDAISPESSLILATIN